MGLDIVAISKAKFVACQGGDKCLFSHYKVGARHKCKDGFTPVCDLKGEGGRSCFVGYPSYATGQRDYRRPRAIGRDRA